MPKSRLPETVTQGGRLATSAMKNRRNTKVVYRKMQYGLAWRLVLHWFMFVLAVAALSPLWQLLLTGPVWTSFSDCWQSVMDDMAMLGTALVCLLPYFIYDSLKLSNRFAGPMYRVHREIAALAKGESVPPLKFREGDFWTEIADDFNGMVRRWGAQRGQERPPLPESIEEIFAEPAGALSSPGAFSSR